MELTLRELFKKIWHKKRKIILFELIIIAFGLILLYPALQRLFNLSIVLSNYRFITAENFISFIVKPTTILILLLIIIVISLYTLMELCGLTIIFDARYNNDTTILRLLKTTFMYARRCIKPKNFLIFVFLMINIPFFTLLLSNISISNFDFPQAFFEIIDDYTYIKVIFYCITFLLIVASIFLIFIYNFFSIEKQGFRDSCKNSIKLVKEHKLELIKVFSITNIVFFISIIIIYLMIAIIVGFGSKLFISEDQALSSFLSIMFVVTYFSKLFFKSLFIVTNIALATMFFNKYYHSNKKLIIKRLKIEKKKNYHIYRRSLLVITVIILLINTFSFFSKTQDNVRRAIGLGALTEVTAHRGASSLAPENTLLAIELAIDDGVDCVEVDVSQTKDGILVLCHDTNLKRLCNIDVNLSEITYEELLNYYVLDEKFPQAKQTIPTLRDALALCDGKVKINIEIKNILYYDQFFDEFYEIIHEYNLDGDCYVTSFNHLYLKKIKEMNKDIRTGLTVFYSYGSYYKISYVDFISINYLALNKTTVKLIHSYGKEVHTWTPNTSNSIIYCLSYGVDNIITDEYHLATEIIYNEKSGFLMKKITQLIFSNK